jgi:hypothetical protein
VAGGGLEQLDEPSAAVQRVAAAHVVPAGALSELLAQAADLEGLRVGDASGEQQEGHGADAHGVEAAVHGLGEGAVEVGEGLAGSCLCVPAEVPQGDGESARGLARGGLLLCGGHEVTRRSCAVGRRRRLDGTTLAQFIIYE